MVDSTDRTSEGSPTGPTEDWEQPTGAESESFDDESRPAGDAPQPAGDESQPLRLPPLTRKDIVRRVIIGLALIAAIAGIYFTGRAATTGLDSTSESLPTSVDRLIPASGDEVLRQAQVGIDVASGYDAYLIINGTEVRSREDGLIKDLGTGQVLVQPGPGKKVESLNEGRNCIVAMVWDSLKTESTAAPVSWCFDAT